MIFFNGFTLLLMLLSGTTAYWIGNHFGFLRGRTVEYRSQADADRRRREFFASLTK